MRRQDFLTCTGLSLDQYIYMVRQGHMPYLDAERRGGWADYSPRQVYATVLTAALAAHVGGQLEAARRVVDLPEPEFSRRIWGALFRPELGDVWGTTFTFSEGAGTRWSVERIGWQFSLIGPGGSGALTFPPELLQHNVETLPTVNLSTIMRGILGRAEAAGIEFDEGIDA